jgi:aconitate hydratase 2/2-methylisocitrate dehydratase
VEEYFQNVAIINEKGAEVYRYMNFNQIEKYETVAEQVNL